MSLESVFKSMLVLKSLSRYLNKNVCNQIRIIFNKTPTSQITHISVERDAWKQKMIFNTVRVLSNNEHPVAEKVNESYENFNITNKYTFVFFSKINSVSKISS